MVLRNSEGHKRAWYGRIISPAMGGGGGRVGSKAQVFKGKSDKKLFSGG